MLLVLDQNPGEDLPITVASTAGPFEVGKEYQWDIHDAISYFSSMDYVVEQFPNEERPWARKVRLTLRHRIVDFDHLIDLWNWWSRVARKRIAQKFWHDSLLSYFERADEQERGLMKSWAIAPVETEWDPSKVGLFWPPSRVGIRGELQNPNWVELQPGWREWLARVIHEEDMKTAIPESFMEHFSRIEKAELSKNIPLAPCETVQAFHRF
jgi:hypothetical protein